MSVNAEIDRLLGLLVEGIDIVEFYAREVEILRASVQTLEALHPEVGVYTDAVIEGSDLRMEAFDAAGY